MKCAVLILVVSCGLAAQQTRQTVPEKMLSGKTIAVRVDWPTAQLGEKMEVQGEAEHFLKKWKRYELVSTIDNADLAALVVVQPVTLPPNIWARMLWGLAASQAGSSCSGQVTATQSGNQISGQMYANCYTRPAPPPLTDYTVLSGGILVFDAEDLRKWRAAGAKDEDIPAPLMAQTAGTEGGRPLIGAAKKLRRVIDAAAKSHPSKSPVIGVEKP
jgi:hypothetical protein